LGGPEFFYAIKNGHTQRKGGKERRSTTNSHLLSYEDEKEINVELEKK